MAWYNFWHGGVGVILLWRRLDQDVLAQFVHCHKAEESAVVENRQSMALTFCQAPEDDIQHLCGSCRHKIAAA